MHDLGKNRRAFVDRAREISLRHFADTASEYDTTYGSIGPVHGQCVREFLSRLPPGAAVLDAACGTGVYFDMLTARTGRLLGIDQSEAMLDRACEKHPHVETRCLALQDLGTYKEFAGAFQGVVCIDALEWVLRDDWSKVLDGFRHVLAAGGLLYMTIEIPGDEETRALRAAPEEGAARGEILVHYWYNHFPDICEVLTWTASHGFRLESHQKCPHYHHLLLRLTSG